MKEIKKEKIELEKADVDDKDIIVKRKDIIDIPIGTHEGRIANLERTISTEGDFEYLSIHVTMIDINIPKNAEVPTLRMGFPLTLSSKSSLGNLLEKAGFDIMKKANYTLTDFKKILLGKKISFLTDKQKNEKGEFSTILRDTIKFIDS